MPRECSDCHRWRAVCEELKGVRDGLLTELRSSRAALGVERAKIRKAIRCLNLLMARYVPVADWDEFDKLNPWLLEVGVSRDITLQVEETADTDGKETTRAA